MFKFRENTSQIVEHLAGVFTKFEQLIGFDVSPQTRRRLLTTDLELLQPTLQQ